MSTPKSNFLTLYILSFSAFCAGLYLPLFTASGAILGFNISEEKVTFFESLKVLEQQGYTELSSLLFAFVVILPAIKFLTILFNIYGINVINIKINGFLLSLQKYAMVDVFVIALIAIASKSNPMFSIQIEFGTYAIITSVLSGILLSLKLSYRSKFSKEKQVAEY